MAPVPTVGRGIWQYEKWEGVWIDMDENFTGIHEKAMEEGKNIIQYCIQYIAPGGENATWAYEVDLQTCVQWNKTTDKKRKIRRLEVVPARF